MIEIINENCPSFRICCGSGDGDQGTGFAIAQNRILTARHVVKDALSDEKIAITLDNPDNGKGKIELEICGPAKEKIELATLVMLQPKNPSDRLPASLPFYRPADQIKEGTPMVAYGYPENDNSQHKLDLGGYADFCAGNPIEGAEQRTVHFTPNCTNGSGFSGSPILCDSRLVGILIAQKAAEGQCEYLYGFGGDAFFQELKELGIDLPASPVPPELPAPAFLLPEEYQSRMEEQLKDAMKKQSECRKDGCQPPIFLRGPDGIGKMEFFWAFAKQYGEGYVYHLEFIDDFLETLNRDKSGIIACTASTASKKLQLLQKCSDTDILIISDANFENGYQREVLAHNKAYAELCKLPLHLVIATRQPVAESLDNSKLLALELNPSESEQELVKWSTEIHETLDSKYAGMLVKQAAYNPVLIRKLMEILAHDSNLNPEEMVNVLRDPGINNANDYLNKEDKYNLFALLNEKTPHSKKKSQDDKIYRSILMLILDELDFAQDAQEYLTAEEFYVWVCSTNNSDKSDKEDIKKVSNAFEKLRRIGMIERSSRGYYSIPIIPQLLLRKEKHEIIRCIDIDFKLFRTRIINARQKFEPADSAPDAKKKQLLNALVQACADPYDSFSLFCASNKQALETHLPELFSFGQLINQALVKCYYGDDPMEKMNKAEAILAQFCRDEQSQRTILAAKLYDMFHSSLYMLNHSKNTDPDICCDALVLLFDAVLTLRPHFTPCYTMKSQVYWYFGKEDVAYHMAVDAYKCSMNPQDHYWADAFMIRGQYLEKQANKLMNNNVAESSKLFEKAREEYHLALGIRNSNSLHQKRRDLSRLIQCYIKQGMIDTNADSNWLWTYGTALLENDRKIYEACKNDVDYIEDSELLLQICSDVEMGIGADVDNRNAKDISETKLKIFKYSLEKCPTEFGRNRIATYEVKFTE